MEHQKTSHHHTDNNHSELIDKLLHCASFCENCSASCLDEDHVKDMAHCIEVNRDCADVCILAAKLLARNSEFAHEVLPLCERICRHCAEECGKHEHDHCKKCAEHSLQCAEACKQHLEKYSKP